jgi:CBS domain-containing protein
MLIQEVMTKDVKCCTCEDSAQKAAEIMKSADTGVVPVVEDGDGAKVVGIVTDRDLCLGVVAEAKDAGEVKVRELLSGRVVGCYADDDTSDVADTMAVYQVRRLPVLDDNDRLIGIVSIGDLSRERAIESDDSGEVLASISDPNGGASANQKEATSPRREKRKS